MGHRILVVDDDPNLRQFLGDALSDNYEVIQAADGRAALTEVTEPERGVDLIVTDLSMPGMDGLDLVQRLPDRVPWIVISGYLNVPRYQDGLKRLSPAAVFKKPFRIAELREAISSSLESKSDVSPGGQGRVLVIDDEEIVRGTVRRILEHAGYEVIEAISGQDGLERFDRQPVDAVLVDLFMPTMSGLDVIKELKKRDPAVRILTVSGSDVRNGMDMLGKAREAGAMAILEKPFRMAGLLEAVANLLKNA